MINIHVCENYVSEYSEATHLMDLDDLEIKAFPCGCANPRSKLSNDYNSSDIFIMSKYCPYLKNVKDYGCIVYKMDYCTEHLIDNSTYNNFINKASYLVTKNWIQNWEEKIQELGFSHKNLNSFFKSWCKQIVLLDSEPDEHTLLCLDSFTKLVNIPNEIYQISLSNTKNVLEKIFYKEMYEDIVKISDNEKRKYQQRIVESEAVRNLINQIISENHLDDLKLKLDEIWKVLFGAQKVVFYLEDKLIVHSENLEDQSKYIYREDSNTILCNLISNNFFIGKMEVRGLLFPDKLDQYDSLIISLINISSIAIFNLKEKSELESTTRFLKESYNSVDYGLLSIDEKGLILFINPVGKELLSGNTYQVDVGSYIRDIVVNEFRFILSVFNELKKDNSYEIRKTRVNVDYQGNSKHYELIISPIFDSKKQFKGIITTIRDITDEIVWMNDRIKIERLEGLNSVSRGIAHEFNNKLTSVNGFVSLAKSQVERSNKIYDYLEKSEKSIEKTIELVSKMITFTDGGEPNRMRTDIIILIQELSDSETTFKQNIKIDIKEELPLVFIDHKQFKIAIKQILRNAVESFEKANAENTIHISLMKKNISNKPFVNIRIADNGIGIPEKEISKVFDPLYTGTYNGTGLGLTIAKNIIIRNGGYIDISSIVGQGTVVSISLPVAHEL